MAKARKASGKQSADADSIIPMQRIEQSILQFRGHKVLLDSDLASLYGVPTKVLNQAVKRNLVRFPADFLIQLTPDEYEVCLKSQFVTSKSKGRGGRRTMPYAFTEHGAVMLASILNSERAIQVSILVVRAFIHLRQLLATHADLARKLDALERRYDAQFKVVFDAIRKLMEPPPEPARKRIGFVTD